MRTTMLSFLIVVLWLGLVPAMAQLPPEILADSHLLRAEQSIRDGDPTRARAEIDKIILLQKEHELDLSDEFHLRHAKAAAAAALPEQALEAVVKYLAAAGRDGPHYVEALELMNQAQDAIEGRKAPQVASTGQTPPTQATIQTPVGIPLATGGTTEGQAALLDADGTPETPPASDCDLWQSNTRPYFRTATVQGVKACLEAGADPNARDMWRTTILHRAVQHNENPAVVQALIKAGADPKARDIMKITILHWAAEHNENPAVIELLLAAGADPNARDRENTTPLHSAAGNNGNPAVIELLLAAGADPKARDGEKITILHWAAEHNENPAVIQTLLAAGADPNARDDDKKTPLDDAIRKNNLAAIEILRHPTAVRGRQVAAARARRKANSGPGFLEAAIGIVGGTAIAAAGGGSEEAVAAGTVFAEGVISGQFPAGSTSSAPGVAPTGSVGAGAGSGQCAIPGYPRPADVQNLGLSWCPATVDFQVRSLALHAAGAQCAIAIGSSSTPEQIQARRQEIQASCARLAALGVSNCRCP